MRYFNRALIVLVTGILIALCLPAVLVGQDTLAETFVSEDGSFTFAYPTGWNAIEQEPEKVILTNDNITITFYGPGFVAQVVSITGETDLETALSSFLDAGGMAPKNITSIEAGDKPMVRADIESAVGTGVAFGIEFDSQVVGAVTAVVPEAVAQDFEPTLMEIVQSFGPADGGTVTTGEALADALQAAAEARANVNCTVRTEQERYASVRVGPGTNRTAILFLPANRDFTVLGQAAANDGAMWWKLDKDEVAPNTGAAELWVDQSQVIALEGCNQVANVEPPPVIPIVAATDTLPTPGTWSLKLLNLRMDCPGSGTITIDSQLPPEPIFVDVLDDGNTLLMETDRLNRTQPGTYVGHFFEPALGGAVTVTIRVVDANRMEGELTGTSEGCSFSMAISLTH